MASKTHEFISDVTSFESTELYASAEELADALRTASAHLRATAAALSPPAAQQVRRWRDMKHGRLRCNCLQAADLISC